MKIRKHGILMIGLVFLFLNAVFVAAVQAEKRAPYVESFQLDVETLELTPGEEYTFHVVFEPKNTLFDYLNWVTTDSEIVVMEENTAKALMPGKVWLYAETFDHCQSKIVEVTVKGEPLPDRIEGKGGRTFMALSEGDINKIEDSGFSSFVKFVRKIGEQKNSLILLGNMEYPSYSLYFDVGRENHADFIARAESLGLDDISEFHFSDEIVVGGSADKLAALLAGNNAVQAVRSNDLLFTIDPGRGDTAKGLTLQGNADVLSNFSAAHASGLDGDGSVVAILDTGILDSHEFFVNEDGTNRVAYQQCYSTTTAGRSASVCKDGAASVEGDAYPYLPEDASYALVYSFSHGTHVAGIAAGNGGVAPGAEIAMVSVFSLIYRNGEPYSSGSYNSDLSQGLEKILEWYDSGVNIRSVNLSLGSYDQGSTTYCDSTYPDIFHLFEEMKERGIQVAVSSGNERYYADYQSGWVGWPACYSNVTAVGALTDSEVPKVAPFSNHGKLVDILAPGNYIKSAVINDSGAFGTMSGTSQAAPMVAGVFALSSGHIGVKEGERLTDTLITMSTKIATAELVTKKVLDLTHIASYAVDQPAELKVDYESIPDAAVISWEAAAHAEGYEVRFKRRMDTDWTAADNGLSTQCTVADLNPDRAYDLEVRSWRQDPNSDARLYSDYARLSFSKNLSRPEGLSSAVFGNVLYLEWTVSPQADSYTVYYRESGTSDWTSEDTTNTFWASSGGIESGKTYEIKVSARNASAEVESETQTVQTDRLWQTGAQITLNAWDYSLATLQWTKVPGAAGYRVSRRKASESEWQDEQLVEETTLTYSDLDGSGMDFRVCARFPSAVESCSTVSLRELPMEAKNVLNFDVKITAEAGSVTLSWPEAAGADGYRIYLFNSNTQTWQEITSTSKNQFTVNYLVSPDAALQYGIRAVKTCGDNLLVPDEMLTSMVEPETVQYSENQTVSWDMDVVNPQPPRFYMLGSR